MVAARDWRLVLAALMALYIGLTLLTANLVPAEWALLRVIVGGLVAIIWYLSAQRAGWGGSFLPFQQEGGVKGRPLVSTTFFRTILVVILALALLTLRPRLPIPSVIPEVRLAFTWLAAFGILGLTLGDEALQTGVALILWLTATQLLFAALDADVWQVWLLSTLELLVALAVGYLMVARGTDPAEQLAPGGES